MKRIDLQALRMRLVWAAGGMMFLAALLVFGEVQLFGFVPVEGHVLAMVMLAFAAGYAMYASVALPLIGSALGRIKT